MTFEQIKENIKKKIYHPIYFLAGDEPFYIDEITNYIATSVLSEADREFNQVVLYGRDTTIIGILSEAKRYPMMSDHNVVIVKEAQHIKDIDGLQSYLENPLKSTILVMAYRNQKLDKRKKITKIIETKGVYFESKKLYDNQVPAWIEQYLKSKGYSISTKATVLLADFLGTDLSKIVNELGKLMILAPEGSEITLQLIEDNIGISKDFNNFELNSAIGKRDVVKANQIIIFFASNPKDNPAIVTLITLFNFFTQLLIYHKFEDKSNNNAVAAAMGVSPFFVKDYATAARNYSLGKVTNNISYIRDYDAKLKGVENVSADGAELMKELIYKIMH